eukprot:6466676-Amphidinium_carterae.6
MHSCCSPSLFSVLLSPVGAKASVESLQTQGSSFAASTQQASSYNKQVPTCSKEWVGCIAPCQHIHFQQNSELSR